MRISEPLVSVVIPTFKRATSLESTIHSVLNQTYNRIEVIVVDDNGENSFYRLETEKLMDKFKSFNNVVYIKHDYNKNGAAARNTGIKNSRGEFIAFLDDDDTFLPQKIEKQLERFYEVNSSDVGAVYCNYSRFVNDKLKRKSNNKKEIDEGNLTLEILLEKNEVAAGSTLLIKKNIVEELKGFDETYTRHQDWEFLLRFFERYRIALCEDNLVKINTNDNINKKSPEQLVEVKEKFLKKFEKHISGLNVNSQKKIHSKHWIQVSKNYYRINNFEKGNCYYRKAKGYGGLTSLDLVKVFIYKFRLFKIFKSIPVYRQ